MTGVLASVNVLIVMQVAVASLCSFHDMTLESNTLLAPCKIFSCISCTNMIVHFINTGRNGLFESIFQC